MALLAQQLGIKCSCKTGEKRFAITNIKVQAMKSTQTAQRSYFPTAKEQDNENNCDTELKVSEML